MTVENGILIGKGGDQQLFLNPCYANRHGLIAGATGTGKTVSLQVLAEGFSRIGVPVFMADIKGELKLVSKHASMVTTQVEQVLKAQNDLLDELNNKNDFVVRVATRGGKRTWEK
mgnify:CR=1 FL=1